MYSKGEQNIITDQFQMIRLSEGCPHKCPWCYEWREIGDDWKIFTIPEIVRNEVRISDMNLLVKQEAYNIIASLPEKLNKKVIRYWLECGIDFRFLTKDFAELMKTKRFFNMHFAWDLRYSDQKRIKKTVDILRGAGFNELSVFMICNHPAVSYKENCLKLNLCKYWNVKVNDCWFDNQISPNIEPITWTKNEIIRFRHDVRKHNQIVNFKIDPEL